jgi:2'-hydroxyisoflavone reductase
MMTDRREFMKQAVVAGGALSLGSLPLAMRATAEPPVSPAPRALRILILGGTGFTGPHQVRYAVARGHHVTVFNRGRRQADLPASVVHLQGDRNEATGTASLKAEVAKGQKWDVVIDNPTTLPFWVRDAGEALRAATNHFIFISTISVYADTSKPGMDESTALAQYGGADALKETMQTFQAGQGRLYGPLKVASERESEKWFPGKTTIIRPGLIVGPGDTSGRFTYWPVRIATGGDVLAPGTGLDPVQFIDARDLAEWTIRVAETRALGTFNATGPAGELSMAEMLGGIRAAFDMTKPTRLVWVSTDFLNEQRIRGWSDMPVWVPPAPDNAGFSRVSMQRALNAGLTFRPLAETAQATLEWFRAQPADVQPRLAGPFTAERESAALQAWRARPKGL